MRPSLAHTAADTRRELMAISAAMSLAPAPLWTDQYGARWAEQQARVDGQLDQLGRAAMDRLGPEPGQRVIDVGCGCGQTVLQLADAVGTTGHVLGVDIARPMLDLAEQRLRASGTAHANVCLADAATHPFPSASVDRIYSRFGVMFFEEPVRAFANLRRALAPGGRLAFVCWQELERNAWCRVPLLAARDTLRQLSPERELPLPHYLLQPGLPGPFSLADPAHIQQVLVEAGFGEPTIEPLEGPISFGGGLPLDEGVEFALAIGPASHVARELEPALLPPITQALRERLADYVTPTGLQLGAAAWIVSVDAA